MIGLISVFAGTTIGRSEIGLLAAIGIMAVCILGPVLVVVALHNHRSRAN
ncbi:hypothetical protein [Quadrisphaera sp. INWT6]|nr:hypothetical protein [Quadrisphaera sp. INWT6]